MLKVSIREIAVHDHPIDHIEPPELPNTEAYREASLRLKTVLEIAFSFIQQSRNPRLAVAQISVALGLPNAAGISEEQHALTYQVTRQGFSKGVVQFLRMSQLPPSFSLKSEEARATYRHLHS